MRRVLKCVLLIIGEVLNWGLLTGQQYDIGDVGAQYGLESAVINHIFEDSRGDVWMAAQQSGLIRLSGTTSISYGKKTGLAGNDATYISEDKSGRIWIATSEGVSRFDGQSFVNYSANGLQNVYALLPLDAGRMLAATRGSGIFVFDGSKWEIWPGSKVLPSQLAFCLAQDLTGRIWAGMEERGAGYFENGRFVPIELPAELTNTTVFCSYAAADGKVWFGTARGHVFYVESGKTGIISFPDKVLPGFIGGITGDKDGNIWIASEDGVFIYNGVDVRRLSTKDGLASNFVQCVASDHEGNIWVGTNGAGVNTCSPRGFYRYLASDGLSADGINSLGFLSETTFLAGPVGRGLDYYDGQKFRSLKLPWKNGEVTSMLSQENGVVWVGSRSSGIARLRLTDSGFTTENEIHNVAGKEIISIIGISEDRSKNIWAACYGSGLLKIDKAGEAVLFSTAPGVNHIPSDNVLCVKELSDGSIWFATIDSGLFQVKGNQIIQFREDLFKRPQGIWTFTEGRGHSLLVSTRDQGLVIIDGKKVTVNERSELNRNIKALYVNPASGDIWTAGDAGIVVFQMTPSGKLLLRKTVSSYDGLTRFGPVENGFLRVGASLWLATNSGLLRFGLDIPEKPPLLPAVRLTQVLLFNKVPDWKLYSNRINPWTNLPESLELPHDENQLLFRFSALSVNQGRAYQYMLEGLEKTWSLPTLNREVAYAGLPSGKYIFRVRTAGLAGLGGGETTFSFEILTPFWETWWFRTLVILSVIGSSVLGFVIRLRQVRLKQEKQETINRKIATAQIHALHSQMNPHFIFNALNGIHRFIWENKASQASEYLTKFARVTRLVLENSRQQWVTLEEDLNMLNYYLELQSLNFDEGLNYSITTDDSLDPQKVMIPPLLLQPFVENSLIHGIKPLERKGTISVFISNNDKELICRIEDDGVGREVAGGYSALRTQHTSLGSVITAERLEVVNILYGGNPHYKYEDKKSENGGAQGTVVTVYLPYLLE